MSNVDPNPKQTELIPIFIAIGSVALGLAVVWLTNELIQPIDGSVLIALILLPIVVYLMASGKLAEFKAPGGIEAKFVQAATESVSVASQTISYDDPQVVAKESVRNLLQRKAQEIDESKPVIMTMILGNKAQYNLVDVNQYLRVLSSFPNFKFVVFLNGDSQFVAYMPAWAFKQMIAAPEL